MTPLTRREIWFALFVTAVFALGAVSGLAVARYLRPGPEMGLPGPPDGIGVLGPSPVAIERSSLVIERLTRDLGLSAAQGTQIEEVLRTNSERFEQFRIVTREEFTKLRQQLNAEIERVLTPEQRERFRALAPRPGEPPPPVPR